VPSQVFSPSANPAFWRSASRLRCVAGIDDYNRLHQNELSHLPGVIRLETSFALRDVVETGRA
jgi:hypothetical protein